MVKKVNREKGKRSADGGGYVNVAEQLGISPVRGMLLRACTACWKEVFHTDTVDRYKQLFKVVVRASEWLSGWLQLLGRDGRPEGGAYVHGVG